MEKGFSTNIKIGVLGGGQLGRMLQQKALDFGLDLAFIDPDSNAPCKEISSRFFKGDFKDFETVYSFGKTRDILTIEIEHVNVDALKASARTPFLTNSCSFINSRRARTKMVTSLGVL